MAASGTMKMDDRCKMADKEEATGSDEGADKRVQAPRGIRRAPAGCGPLDARGIVACMLVENLTTLCMLLCTLCNSSQWSDHHRTHSCCKQQEGFSLGGCHLLAAAYSKGVRRCACRMTSDLVRSQILFPCAKAPLLSRQNFPRTRAHARMRNNEK